MALILSRRRKPAETGDHELGEGGDYREDLEGAMSELLEAIQNKSVGAMADAFEYAHELCAKASMEGDGESEPPHNSHSKEY